MPYQGYKPSGGPGVAHLKISFSNVQEKPETNKVFAMVLVSLSAELEEKCDDIGSW